MKTRQEASSLSERRRSKLLIKRVTVEVEKNGSRSQTAKRKKGEEGRRRVTNVRERSTIDNQHKVVVRENGTKEAQGGIDKEALRCKSPPLCGESLTKTKFD